MNQKEKALAAKLLDVAADLFSNRGCSDFDLKACGFSHAECLAMSKEINESMGDPDEEPYEHIADWSLMRHMANKIRED